MHLLVIRFSAMGDVAIAAPVIKGLLETNLQLRITLLTKPLYEPFFEPNDRLNLYPVDLKNKHRGLFGLMRLAKGLAALNLDGVVDIHDVLRSKTIRTMLVFKGIKASVFEKGRKEKQRLIGKNKDGFKKLRHSCERYLEAFNSFGLNVNFSPTDFVRSKPFELSEQVAKMVETKTTYKWIGIAPFAAHAAKEWEKIPELLEKLQAKNGLQVFLFGGGSSEQQRLIRLKKQFPNTSLFPLKLNLIEELQFMQHLDVMVSMDSSNMHLASLVGTTVVSIWGPTHPFLGFAPLNNEQGIIEISRKILPERPCSIYGKLNTERSRSVAKKSMDLISVEMITKKIDSTINS